MHRFYAEQLIDHQARLSPEDEHHALRVLRMKPGDPCELIWNGCRYQAEMRENGTIETFSLLQSTEPSIQITLFQGLPKSDKMDWIVQKAVEIGVSTIVPVIMHRCVARLEPRDFQRKQERWQRIAREAGKQSGRCRIPDVSLPVTLSELPAASESLEARLVPWEGAHGFGPLAFAASHPSLQSLGLLIGPEGGIEAEEIQQLEGIFRPFTLGPRILRTETAGLTAVSALLALYGEME